MTFVERCQAFAAKHHKISPTLLYVTFFVMLGFVYPTLIYAAEVTTSPHSATSTEFVRQPRLNPQQILFGTSTSDRDKERDRIVTTSSLEKTIQYRTARIQRLRDALMTIEKQAKDLRLEIEDLQYASPTSTESLDLKDFNAKIGALMTIFKKTNFNLELTKLKVELKNEYLKRDKEMKRELLKQETEQKFEAAKHEQEQKNEQLKKQTEQSNEQFKKEQELLNEKRKAGLPASSSAQTQ